MNIRRILLLFIRQWPLGSIAGVPIQVDISCVLSVLVWFYVLARMSQDFNPRLGGAIGIIVSLALPISVFVHELSRALTAKHYQIPVQGVYCRGMGAMAKIGDQFAHPLQMLEVYFSGSLVTFILYGVLNLLSTLPLNWGGTALISLNHIKEFNFAFAFFSLTPLIPLNGGYLFKGLRWEWTRKPMSLMRFDGYGAYIAGAGSLALGMVWYGQKPFLSLWTFYLGIMTCLRHLLFEGSLLPLAPVLKTQQSGARFSTPQPRQRTFQFGSMPSVTTAGSTSSQPIRAVDFSYLDAEFLSVADPDQSFQEGMVAAVAMELTRAISAFSQVLSADPDNYMALHNRGNAYLQSGNKSAALTDFQAVLRLQPDLLETYLGKGNSYFALGDFPGAIMEYSEFLSRDPDCARAYFNRATAQVRNGNRQLAIADYQKAQTLFTDKADLTHLIDERLERLTT
ncbi:MAG: tetratricopeptide repeat protein [Acaryochloris sp. SU_5_25]|nr:tetratricopeptide repeat protein [Acaryochloris sp. SU_5_25]